VRTLEDNQVRVIDAATKEFGQALIKRFPEGSTEEGTR